MCWDKGLQDLFELTMAAGCQELLCSIFMPPIHHTSAPTKVCSNRDGEEGEVSLILKGRGVMTGKRAVFPKIELKLSYLPMLGHLQNGKMHF